MLKGIPPIISPDLIKILMEMGHGDTIVLADGNFPGTSIMKEGNKPVVRCDGHNIPELLDAILQLFPLDLAKNDPIVLMEVTPGENYLPPVWEKYDEVFERLPRSYPLTSKEQLILALGHVKKSINKVIKPMMG